VLIVAAIGLFDVAETRRLWKINRAEFALSIITMFGVVALDIVDGILMAVLIAVLLLLARSSRPPDAVLGRVKGLKGFHNVVHRAAADVVKRGALPLRVGAGVLQCAVFQEARAGGSCLAAGIKWFVVDGGPINVIDSTGADMLEALAGDLRARGIRLGFANSAPRCGPCWNAPA
jgi:MFS superfamily sulfate permease-like transporter